jgi:hypothetical protein
VALGVFSWRSPVIFGLYMALLVPVLAFHWFYSCRTCTNVACALNAASEEFFLGRPRRRIPVGTAYSDTRASVAGVPLVFTVGVGFYGTFLADWRAGLACTALLLAAGVGYTKGTCSECTNECPANRNAEYWEWKRGSE